MVSLVLICIVLISSGGIASSSSEEDNQDKSLLLIDLCFQKPCKNNGICIGEGKCECIPPYKGEDCSKDPCSDEPCQNDGMCVINNSSYICSCINGFSGENCTVPRISPLTTADTTTEQGIKTTTKEIKIDLCYKKPCNNGGTCIDKERGFTCVCLPQYSGDTCDKVEYTCEKPCQNGGICKKNGNDIKCECVEPYFGQFCERDPCEPNPCKNGGMCFKQNNTYTCICSVSFAGKNCTEGLETTPIVTTESFETLNATIDEDKETLLITAVDTTIQPTTQQQIDYCYEEPCENGGTCITKKDSYECLCLPQFSGENCVEESTTTSTSEGTTNETTMPSISTQKSTSTSTTEGTTIETTMSSTAVSTREPTTTTPRSTTYETESTTTTDETTITNDSCITSPCLNNGSCISIDNNVRCNCTYPYSGEFCDIDSSEKNYSSNNAIVYACTGSAGAVIIIFLIGFSVLWHLKRIKRRKKEGYYHNADLSSMESENSRTYII